MKIQEMRSGNLHLARRREGDDPEHPFDMPPADMAIQAGQAETACELDQPLWSVVSFEKCEASGLTYDQAADLRRDLEAREITGLCIVTNAAAGRTAG